MEDTDFSELAKQMLDVGALEAKVINKNGTVIEIRLHPAAVELALDKRVPATTPIFPSEEREVDYQDLTATLRDFQPQPTQPTNRERKV